MERQMHRFVTTCTILALLLGAATTVMADWPTVGGNSQRNGLDLTVLGPDPTGPIPAWEINSASWFGMQCFIEGEYLVTMYFNGSGNNPLVCLDMADGSELWRVQLNEGTNTRTLPVGVRDGRVYALGMPDSGTQTLHAYDLETGDELWTCDMPIHQGIIATAAYAANGDLIMNGSNEGNGYRLSRIDHTTGDVLWSTNRSLAVVGGGEHVCVYDSKVFGWQGAIGQSIELTAWDIETGAELYAQEYPGDGDQEIPISMTPDGHVLVIRDTPDNGLLRYIEDTGEGFVEQWTHPVSWGTFQPVANHHGVGPDGSIYVKNGSVIERLDPATGDVLNTSDALVTESNLKTRFAIDLEGTIYIANGAYEDGALYCLSPELETHWSWAITSNVYGGPAFGPNGEVAISGNGGQVTLLQGRGSDLPPTPFALLEPSDESVLRIEPMGLIEFAWQESFDPEGEDPVTYTLHMVGSDPDMQDSFTVEYGALPDTTYDMSWTDSFVELLDPYALATWDVTAEAADLFTPCDEPFLFYVVHGAPPDGAIAISPVDTTFLVGVDTTITFDWFDGTDPDDDTFTYAVRGTQLYSDGQERAFVEDSLEISQADIWLEQRNQQSFNPFEVEYQIATVADVVDTTWSQVYSFWVQDNWSVDRDPAAQPEAFAISSVYPNPFNAVATVSVRLPERGHLRVAVYDMLGRRVQTLMDGYREAGDVQLSWHAGALPSGTYVVRAQLNALAPAMMKVMLVK